MTNYLDNSVDMIKFIEKSLQNLAVFESNSYTGDIRHEVESIRKYYKATLYDLKKIKYGP